MTRAKVTQETIKVYNIVKLCERFGSWPRSGGLLDQDYLFVHLLHEVLELEEKREELDRSKTKNTPKI